MPPASQQVRLSGVPLAFANILINWRDILGSDHGYITVSCSGVFSEIYVDFGDKYSFVGQPQRCIFEYKNIVFLTTSRV